jgi:hypothetical protein
VNIIGTCTPDHMVMRVYCQRGDAGLRRVGAPNDRTGIARRPRGTPRSGPTVGVTRTYRPGADQAKSGCCSMRRNLTRWSESATDPHKCGRLFPIAGTQPFCMRFGDRVQLLGPNGAAVNETSRGSWGSTRDASGGKGCQIGATLGHAPSRHVNAPRLALTWYTVHRPRARGTSGWNCSPF